MNENCLLYPMLSWIIIMKCVMWFIGSLTLSKTILLRIKRINLNKIKLKCKPSRFEKCQHETIDTQKNCLLSVTSSIIYNVQLIVMKSVKMKTIFIIYCIVNFRFTKVWFPSNSQHLILSRRSQLRHQLLTIAFV